VVKVQGGGYYRRCVISILSDQIFESGLMKVVAHGDILRWIADGQSQGYMSSRVRPISLFLNDGANIQQWLNCEVKIMSFESDDDEDAKMVDIPAEGKVPRDATDDPTTDEMS
jgi:hypothetical protein